MITLLYRKIFAFTLQKQLAKNFAYFCAGKSMTAEQQAMLTEQNTSFYSSKMKAEFDQATAELKNRQPWLDLVSWAYLIAAFVCSGAVIVGSYSNLALPIALVAGMIGFGIITFLLVTSTKLFNVPLDESRIRSPASSIAVQIPLCLIQILLGIGLLMIGALTHNVSSIISAIAILGMSGVMQYTAMSNFLVLFESRPLAYEETKEFLKATPGLYTRTAKAWLLDESMEGATLNIGSLQRLQGFDKPHLDSDDESSLTASLAGRLDE